jgi:hypothetical protein
LVPHSGLLIALIYGNRTRDRRPQRRRTNAQQRGQEGEGIDRKREDNPAEQADAKDAEDDSDDEHGGASVTRSGRAYHHLRAPAGDIDSPLSISQSSLDTTCEVQRVSRMDGVEPDRRAGAGASPWKSSRGTMPLTATRTAAAALLSPCVPATR